MTPIVLRPIDTAPRDGTEIYLVSIQDCDGRSTLVSIHNGYWHKDNAGFSIGQPHHDIRIGDGCATHWLPTSAITLPLIVKTPCEHGFDNRNACPSCSPYLPRSDTE